MHAVRGEGTCARGTVQEHCPLDRRIAGAQCTTDRGMLRGSDASRTPHCRAPTSRGSAWCSRATPSNCRQTRPAAIAAHAHTPRVLAAFHTTGLGTALSTRQTPHINRTSGCHVQTLPEPRSLALSLALARMAGPREPAALSSSSYPHSRKPGTKRLRREESRPHTHRDQGPAGPPSRCRRVVALFLSRVPSRAPNRIPGPGDVVWRRLFVMCVCGCLSYGAPEDRSWSCASAVIEREGEKS